MTQLYTTIKSFRESFNSKLKRINENVNDTYLHINLLDKYKESGDDILYKQQFEEYKQQLKGFKTVSEKTGLKTGDIIEFISGYNMDIKYITEILGFDEDDDIYLLLDCYLSPIRMEDRRGIKVLSTNESKINENIDTSTIAKGLSDLNERRPERMKRPNFNHSNNFAMMRSGSRGGGLYIQDEAEEICQDKYGKEKGTKYLNGLIDAQRGAMFKACDEIIREKSYLLDTLKIKYNPMDYFEYSYFALLKLLMDSIGQPYKILSQQDVDAKNAEKERLKKEEEAKQKAILLNNNIKKFNDEVIRIYQQFPGYENIKPDGKDIQRIEDMFNKRNVFTDSRTMANAIKDKNKAIKRGNAIIDYLKNKNTYSTYELDYAKTFFRRATQL